MKRLLNTKTLIAAAGFLIVLLLWIIFAPVQIGGNAFYVIVNGNSMEPGFYKGDLVVLRTETDYQVGDIVAYKYPQLGNVFHRIVEIKGNAYFLKGDHNSWIDSYQPSKNEIIAKYWFVIRKAGTLIATFKSPWVLALLAGIILLIMGWTMVNSSRNGLLSGKKERKKLTSSIGFKIAGWRDGYYWLMYALGLIALVLGVVAFTRPTTKTAAENIEYQQLGIYTYSGRADQAVYDTQGFTTGDPVFMQLSCKVNFTFQYLLTTPSDFMGTGTYHLKAVLQGSNGWRRTFELTPENEFSGNSFDSKATLDICALRDLITGTENITEVEHLQYTVAISPDIKVKGEFSDLPLDSTFSPTLTFNIDSQQFYVPVDALEQGDPYQPSNTGFVEKKYITANSIPIFSFPLPVAAARTTSLVLLIAALLGLAVPMFIYSRSGKEDEKLKAKMLVGPMLVETLSSPVSGLERVVDLVSFEDVVQLAERMGTTVFFHQQPLYTDYMVKDSNIVYRYRQPAMLIGGEADAEFVTEVRQAIRNHEFALFFQPIQSIENGRVSQVEALLRWNHPKKGMIMAGEFLPQAEQSVAIKLIDEWVIENACTQLKKWHDAGLDQVLLSINISSQQLKDESLAGNIEDALLENQIEAHAFGIELSLDQLTFDAVVLNNLKILKKLGVTITVKSANSSSLEKLHTLETVDQLKLGRPILGEALANEQAGRMAQKIIDDAHKKHVDVIAAGVETDEQMGFLRLNACDEVQGYLVSHPLSEKDIDTWLKNVKKNRA